MCWICKGCYKKSSADKSEAKDHPPLESRSRAIRTKRACTAEHEQTEASAGFERQHISPLNTQSLVPLVLLLRPLRQEMLAWPLESLLNYCVLLPITDGAGTLCKPAAAFASRPA